MPVAVPLGPAFPHPAQGDALSLGDLLPQGLASAELPWLGAETCSRVACRGLAPFGAGWVEAGILGEPASLRRRSVTAGWWERGVCPPSLACWEQGWRAGGGSGAVSACSWTSMQPGSWESGTVAMIPAPGPGGSSSSALGEAPAGWMPLLDARLLLREGSSAICASDRGSWGCVREMCAMLMVQRWGRRAAGEVGGE